MNLSPEWLTHFTRAGWHPVHWKAIGPINATDEALFHWAQEHNRILFTQDLDFARILFASGSGKPSVVLLRTGDELNEETQASVLTAFRSHSSILESGAIPVVERQRLRLRRLPIQE
jgi:predicted nuclease of predicted toxin-antitoxin system